MSNSKVKPEKNQIYCTFYQRIGACMHGESCSRMHIHPQISKTILLCNLYPNPLKVISMLPENTLIIEPNTLNRNFDEFYIDIYEELRKYGPIEDLLVAANLCDHLVGNVLVRYGSEEDALTALEDLKNRFYAGRPIEAQFSPVYNFDDAVCKQFFTDQCQHGDNCNFIHPRFPSDYVMKECPLIQKRSEPGLSHKIDNIDDDRRKNRSHDFDLNSRNRDRDRDLRDDRNYRKDKERSRGRSSKYDLDYSDDDDGPSRHHRGNRSSRNSRYDDRDRDQRDDRDRDDRYGRDRRGYYDDRDDRSYRSRDDDQGYRPYESNSRYSPSRNYDDRRREQMPMPDQRPQNNYRGRYDEGRPRRDYRDDLNRRRSYDQPP